MADARRHRAGLYTSEDIVLDTSQLLDSTGGFGDIHSALLRVAGGEVKVALKRLRCGSEDDGRKVKGELLEEAGVWLHLHHPNIIPFYGFYINRGDTFLISPLLEQGSLPKYLVKNPTADRIKFILEVAAGLVHLHKEGVIHGDMKAANVLVSATGAAQLCDFGLSKFIGTAPGRSQDSTLGSLNWISPERLLGDDMARTEASDVYAFALTAYEILSDRIPFQELARNPMQFIQAIDEPNARPLPIPTHAADGTSYALLWGTISLCWDREPSKRPTISAAYADISSNYTQQHGLVLQQIESYRRGAFAQGSLTPTNNQVRNAAQNTDNPGASRTTADLAITLSGLSLDSPLLSAVLPAKPEIILGRDDEVESIAHRLHSTIDGRFVIRGPGGIGKTTLVRAVAYHPLVVQKYVTRIMWVPCAEATTPELLLELVARSVGVTTDSPGNDRKEKILNVLRSSVSPHMPHLMICDNFETPLDAPRGQGAVADILQTITSITGVSLLLTMRGHTPPAAGRIAWSMPLLEPLSTLSLEASRELYLTIHGEASEDPHLDEFLLKLSYMPLAVRLAATYGNDGDVMPGTLVKRWESRTIIKALDHSDERTESVAFSVKLSIESNAMKRTPEALTLLTILAHLPGGARREFIPQFAPFNEDLVDDAIATLMKVSLIQSQVTTGIITMLSPVRTVVLEAHPIDEQHHAKLLSAYYDLIDGHSSGPSDPNHIQNMVLLRTEQVNCETLLRSALGTAPSEDSIEATYQFTDYLRRTFPDTALISMAVEKARSLESSQKSHILAEGLWELGQNQMACSMYPASEMATKEAATIYEQIGNVPGHAIAVQTLADVYRMLGRYTDAVSAAERARVLFRQIGNVYGEANALDSLGDAYRMLNRYNDAVGAAEQARVLFRQIGKVYGEANALNSLGDAYRMLEQYDDAVKTAEQATVLHRQNGDVLGEANALLSLGNGYCMIDRFEDAIQVGQQALKLYLSIGDQFGVGNASWSLAVTLQKQGKLDETLVSARAALELFTRIGVDREIGILKRLIAKIEAGKAEGGLGETEGRIVAQV